MKKIWIDTDMGIDDCFAILYAHNHPHLEIVGISLSQGNVSLEQAINNYNYLSYIFELSYPIYVGASRIESFPPADMTEVLGKSGLGWVQPPVLKSKEIKKITSLDITDSIELIALAPPYNLPEILSKNKDKISKIHLLSGSLNSHEPEFNLQSAPQSTSYSILSGIPTIFYTQDLSEQLPLFRLYNDVNYSKGFQKRFLETLMNWYDGKPLFDPVVPIAVANSHLFDLEEFSVDVLSNPGFLSPGKDSIKLAHSVNHNAILEEFAKYVTKGRRYSGLNIISPHLDDAVLSIGGIMGKYGKTPMNILNVFSNSTHLKSGFSEKELVSNIRKIEEMNAANISGANSVLLRLDDWTLRGYNEWNDSVKDSLEYIGALFSKIHEHLVPNYRTLLPLSIGDCIDHRLLRDIPIKSAMYYEDLPYAAYPELVKETGLMQPNPIKISRFMGLKASLMKAYSSQLTGKDVSLVQDYSLHKNGQNYEVVWG